MATQPIKKTIIADNPYLAGVQHEEPEYILIIDGNSLLKGSMVKCPKNTNGVRVGTIMNFLWKIKILLHKRTFSKIFCAWDGQNSGLLRYELYPEYKKSRKKQYSEYDRQINAFVYSILDREKKKREALARQKDPEKYLENQQKREDENEDFEKCKLLLQELFEYLFIRQVQDDAAGTESDDIIAHIVLNKHPNQKVYIITGDSDLHQLIDKDVAVYDPKKKEFYHTGNYQEKFGIPLENILLNKLLRGDSSDNISGVKGLGEVTIKKHYPELYSNIITIDDIISKTKLLVESGGDKKSSKVFKNILDEFNDGTIDLRDKIINLKRPILGKEIKSELDELVDSPLDPSDRDFETVYRIICREELVDLQGNKFSSFFIPFKRVIEREKLFYKKSGFTEIE